MVLNFVPFCGMSFMVSNLLNGDGELANKKDYERETGRGGPDEPVVLPAAHHVRGRDPVRPCPGHGD